MFMLSEKLTICVKATELCIKGDCITAWLDGKRVAIFRTSEVIGCWLDGSVSNAKVYQHR